MATKAENAQMISEATGLTVEADTKGLTADQLQAWAETATSQPEATRLQVLRWQVEQRYGAAPAANVSEAVLKDWLARDDAQREATVSEIQGPDPKAADTLSVVCTGGMFVDASQDPGHQIVKDKPVLVRRTFAVAQALASGLLKEAGKE